MSGASKHRKPNVGQLRHRITFQEPVATSDGQGGSEIEWTDVTTVWAELQPVSARERLFAQQLQYQRTHTIMIRYLEGVSNSWRAKFTTAEGDRYFQLKGSRALDERRFWLILDAEENQAS